MFQPIHIALQIEDSLLARMLAEEVLNRPDIVLAPPRGAGKKGEPDIVLLDDGAGDLLKRLPILRQKHPQASLFVVSADGSPDQIVEAMKAGANEYFLKPVNARKIQEAVGRRLQQLREEEKNAGGKVYAFIGSKGGIGTTVLAVNTAAALAGEGARVALLDLDLMAGDSGVLVDTVPKTTLADVVRNYDRLDPVFLAGVMEKTASGFDLLAAPTAPEEGMAVTGEQIGATLRHLRRLYDTVLIDSPAMSGDERILANLRTADTVFLGTDLSVPAVRNVSRQMKFLRKAEIGRIEIVVNRFLKGQSATLEEVEKTIGQRVFWLFPNDYENALAAVNRGTPLPQYNPRSVLCRSLFEFARKLQDPAAFPNYRGVKSLLGKAV